MLKTCILTLAFLFVLSPFVARAQDDALFEMDDCNAVLTGKWTKAASPRAYNNSYSYARCTGTDSISKEANFDSSVYGVTATSTSSYSVYVHWAGHPSATTDAHYRIFDGSNQVGVCTTNQSVLTGEWMYCDTVQFTSGNPVSIVLGNDCEKGKIVIADAVRLVKMNGGPQGPVGPQGPAANITALQAQVAALTAQVAAIQQITQYMSVSGGAINGLAGPHVIFSGANVHIQSGSGATNDNGALTGLGNLVVGYNEISFSPDGQRIGSHNLVIGMEHSYTNYSGLVAGYGNLVTGASSSVSGGTGNTASGLYSSVSGGQWNMASGLYSSVSGGYLGTACGLYSSVSGGTGNTSSGFCSSVSGGTGNRASGTSTDGSSGTFASSVSGGIYNTASGSNSSVSGGSGNTAGGDWSSVSGGTGLGAQPNEWMGGILSHETPPL